MLKFLVLKSFRKRKFVTFLTVLAISLSLSLYLSVEKIRNGIEESFTSSISNADLIVGARSGPLQLLLYTVFHMGSPTNNITMQSYDDLRSHPAVDWTIPISLGDSYRGHKVVATDSNFYKHFQFYGDRKVEFAKGKYRDGIFDVFLGSNVAKKLKHHIGDSIILSHGLSEDAILQHDNTPFTVKGILKRTGTPIDKSVFISLDGMEAMHVGWGNGGEHENTKRSRFEKSELQTSQITSFILRSKSRIALLSLQHFISKYKNEPLSAIIPALTLAKLWGLLDKVELSLVVISFFIVVIGFLSLLIVLYMSINERKKEIRILRSLGASSLDICLLLVVETFLLTLGGVILGVILNYSLIFLLSPIVESQYGLHIKTSLPTVNDFYGIIVFVFLGGLFGLIPALRAYSSSTNCQLD